MYGSLFLSPLLAAGCLLSPAQKPAVQVPSGSEMFPQPTAGISIAAGPGEDMKLEKLLDEFSKVTGVALLSTPETKSVLAKSTTGLNRGIDIPAGEVYSVVETILIRNELALVPVHDRDPRIASVVALNLNQNGSQVLRASAIFVPARDIAAFARHPAVLVTTFLDLPHVDVRTISNSLRTMFTDANTQQIIPVGNSNALIVTGFGGTVAGIVRLLQEVDENAKREMAEQGESKVQSSASTKEEKPK